MKVLIVEDELHNQRLLKGMIESLRPQWYISEMIESIREAVEWLGHNVPDLIFMDIQLVDGICFSIFDQVQVDSPVIFTTAFDNYAIRAFKVNSIDYLLKPIKENELETAINKYETRKEQQTGKGPNIDYNEVLDAIRSGEKKYRKRFIIQGSTAFYKLKAEDVAYFTSRDKISFAVTFDQKEHIIEHTLETLENELDPEMFFRSNRSTIVHIDAIYKFENYFGGKLQLKLLPEFNVSVTISRLKNNAFKEWVGK
jgi:DNA-binding LytR/AlgR family response regulator